MRAHRGFTLIEITVMLMVVAVSLGTAGFFLVGLTGRASARSAAQIFSRDLAQARAFATRSREAVTVYFREDSLAYRVESEGGRILLRRSFGEGDDISLTGVDLELAGDSVHFSARGLADVPGLGTAAFRAGAETYEVRFNGTGVSRVSPR